MYTSEKILTVLERIVHPSSGKDIVSMGMIKDLTILGKKISFSLTFSAFNDPLKTSLKNACEQILKDEFNNIEELDIKIITPVAPVVNKTEETLPKVKNIIAIASGKGGVGKSTVAANLAVAFAKSGAKTGLIDADIYGPSIPKMFDIENKKPSIKPVNGKDKIVPVEKYGVKILSIGFFVDPEDATIWRGPMASNALKQLVNDGHWEELDYLFIDLPPGTSDIHITVSQDLNLSGAIIVSTPQDIALADVTKGINMFRNDKINVPILGLIENMAWFAPEELPGNKYYIFGKSGCKELSKKMDVPFIGEIPIIQSVREDADKGSPSVLKKNKTSEYFKHIAEAIRVNLLKQKSGYKYNNN